MKVGSAKGKDFVTSIGPWIVTADALAPYVDPGGHLELDCRAYVARHSDGEDGLRIGRDLLSHMNWTFPEMVDYAALDSVVVAGDLLASGTTAGGGCLAELWGCCGQQIPRCCSRSATWCASKSRCSAPWSPP